MNAARFHFAAGHVASPVTDPLSRVPDGPRIFTNASR